MASLPTSSRTHFVRHASDRQAWLDTGLYEIERARNGSWQIWLRSPRVRVGTVKSGASGFVRMFRVISESMRKPAMRCRRNEVHRPFTDEPWPRPRYTPRLV